MCLNWPCHRVIASTGKLFTPRIDRDVGSNLRCIAGGGGTYEPQQISEGLATPNSRPRWRYFLHFSKGAPFAFASILTRSRCGHHNWNVLVQHSPRREIEDANALGVARA